MFGSYAYGNPTTDSDFDLYVVLNDNHEPKNWHEKMMIKEKVVDLIIDLKKKYDIDLIVHTIPLYEKFVKTKSLFYKEILEKGECFG